MVLTSNNIIIGGDLWRTLTRAYTEGTTTRERYGARVREPTIAEHPTSKTQTRGGRRRCEHKQINKNADNKTKATL